ncbi:hypothetical protein PUNSTDRAFT_137277 [Punctularia strigosozonata HHB-11173 SS5]|uniref:uncharacterized protein n=1 Tax=Punctularia strigosozonata (strain HHB-11173) TaxID=741275 RepID=UPI00044173D0|nr:uncharacterized protein PUNSTDRAFT_137277 [Punctularia strigosozonata HHB-11173 SS5]EIN05786.1 hypothetical protein PUNSTDRAFT_137277 [Punctularia strigosozonata HHB-11173 SS5]
MAAPMPIVNPTPYIQAVAPWLPANYPLKLQSLCQSSEDVLILEVVLRFLCGGDCPPDAAPRVRQEWAEKQRAVMLSIQALRGPPPPPDVLHKRKYSPDEPDGVHGKRSRTHSANGNGHGNGHHHLPPPHPHPHPHPRSPALGHPHPHQPMHGHPHHAPPAHPHAPPPPGGGGGGVPPDAPPNHLKVSPDSPTPRSAPPINEDAHPLYTVHALSATSPVRKKVDVTIGRELVQMLHPVTAAIEATLPAHIFTRAFVLPTRGKARAHWTVVLLASDAPGKPQVIFGIDAAAPAGYRTTEYEHPHNPEPGGGGAGAGTGHATAKVAKSMTHHPRGTPTIPSLRAFLAHLPNAKLLEPSTAVFKSAVLTTPAPTPVSPLTSGAAPDRADLGGVPGIEAYRGSKPGTLWFFREGVLWGESKPCEFWAVEDLAGGGEAVRLLSATGKTCSIYVKRAPKKKKEGDRPKSVNGEANGRAGSENGSGSGSEEEEGEEEGEETEFSMVDGREQEPVTAWVRAHRHLFGKGADAAHKKAGEGAEKDANGEEKGKGNVKPNGHPAGANGKQQKGYWGKVTVNNMPDDDSDEDDESYRQSSGSDDGGSARSSSSSSSNRSAGSASGSASGSNRSPSAEHVNDSEELSPDRHPLSTQPGATQRRISKAAVEAVVDMLAGPNGTGNPLAQTRAEDSARARGVPPPPPYGMMNQNGRSVSPVARNHNGNNSNSNNDHGQTLHQSNKHNHGKANGTPRAHERDHDDDIIMKDKRADGTGAGRKHALENVDMVESEDDEVDEFDELDD